MEEGIAKMQTAHAKLTGREKTAALKEAGWQREGANSWRHPDHRRNSFSTWAALHASASVAS